jgi:protein transport protein SEC24
MADYQMYHALGDEHSQGNAPPNQQQQPPGNQYRPQVAPSPGGYQQQGGGFIPAQQPAPGYQQDPSYFQQGQPGAPAPPPQDPTGLAQQIGGMAIGTPTPTGTVRKKKDRHAYHNLQSGSGSSQAYNGVPQGNFQAGQYLNQAIPPHPQTGETITPAMSQFPAPASAQYIPGQPASGAEHAARSTGVSTQGKVDPEQVPSIPRLRDEPAQYYLENLFPTMEPNLIPPPAAIPFVSIDQGNSSPRFARLTMTHIPSSAEVLASTALPLGLVIQPLAPLQEGENEIPVLDFGEIGPPRCRRCRAYINPFMTFKSGGNKFVCNMCTFPNDTPMEYFAPTDPSGTRVDRMQRPELHLGTVEFVVPKEYWSKPPVPIRWLFMIDVTEESVNKGFLTAFCEGIMNALYGGSVDTADGEEKKRKLPEGAKVGIVTYDKAMHFYNMSPVLEHAQMLVMPDLEDPFVPLSDGMFVDPDESKSIITQLLSQLPQMFSPDITTGLKNPEPALLPALKAAVQALNATGGKIICSLGALPTWGPGRLFLRDNNTAVAGTDAEKKLLTTEHPGFQKVTDAMIEHGIGIDFFLAAPSGGYLDIATIGKFTKVRSELALIFFRSCRCKDWW